MERKIPPPIVMLLCMLPSVLVANFELSQFTSVRVGAVLMLLVSVMIALAALREFQRQETTIHPFKFGGVNQLVTSGIFKHSRNPMYLSLLMTQLAVSLLFEQYWLGLFMGAVFWGYITYFQIKPEEQFLTRHFGESFMQYSLAVRRWL
ncbi:isoprenylcysteine carboxylmethyltransferase family protein [Vibrio sp. FNV 38]|nr:isoprenylcysteine carboxylmethyltransferase family protein [Vibrio sp. FNV 38]